MQNENKELYGENSGKVLGECLSMLSVAHSDKMEQMMNGKVRSTPALPSLPLRTHNAKNLTKV